VDSTARLRRLEVERIEALLAGATSLVAWHNQVAMGRLKRNTEWERPAMNEAEMKAELERLRAENAKLKSKDSAGLSSQGQRKKAPYPSTEWDVSLSPLQGAVAPHNCQRF